MYIIVWQSHFFFLLSFKFNQRKVLNALFGETASDKYFQFDLENLKHLQTHFTPNQHAKTVLTMIEKKKNQKQQNQT